MTSDRNPNRRSASAQPSRPQPFDRNLPFSAEAEAGVIGGMLLNSLVCDEVATIVRAQDFYSDANRRLFQCLIDMHNEGKGIDLILLTERLRRSGEMEQIGGEAYLAELMESIPIAAHAPRYAEIVRDKAILRSLIETTSNILTNAYESDRTPRELISEAEENIFRISDERSSKNVLPMSVIMDDLLDKIDSMTGDLDGVPTGFAKIDDMLNGLHASELIILAARPSMGKTALAANIAEYVSIETKQPVLFFSLEMSREELSMRMLCSRARLRKDDLYMNRLDENERKRFRSACSDLGNASLFIDDTSAHTVAEIAATARRIKRQNGLALIIIDYLTYIEPDNPLEPRQEQVAKAARRLKGLARELDIPVLCLAQVNRQAEQSKDNRPRLSNLCDSGAIEQDADVVMFVHREEYYRRDENAYDQDLKGKAEIIIAKQRNGSTGTVELRWVPEFTRFMNERDDDPDAAFGDYSELNDNSSDEF